MATAAHADGRDHDRGGRSTGSYVAGDIHNHTTCSDGSISMQKLVKKSTDTTDTPWGLDWFVQAGHGGSGNRNCTLVEDATLGTPGVSVTSPARARPPPGETSGSHARRATSAAAAPNQQHVALAVDAGVPVPADRVPQRRARTCRCSSASRPVVPGHEHTSMSVINGPDPRESLEARDAADDARLHRDRQRRLRSRSGNTASTATTADTSRGAEQPVGLRGSGQRQRSRPELERRRPRS